MPTAVRKLLFLGDAAGYYPFLRECLEALRPWNVASVRGNHDQILVDCVKEKRKPSEKYQRKYGSALGRSLEAFTEEDASLISSWPRSESLQLKERTIGIWHGAPWNALNGRVYPDFKDWDRFEALEEDVILLGHTHYPLLRRTSGKLILNPGSVGQARDRSGEACYAVLCPSDMTAELKRVSYDPALVIKDAVEHDPDSSYLKNVLVR
jgi:predicted phosphodiesterase